jgi:hypothetical protein
VNVFKLMRIIVLLSVLFVIVVGTWITERRLANWDRPTLVTVYPVVAEDDDKVRRYAASVSEETFAAVNDFFERESRPYGFRLHPAFRFQVAEVSDELPPEIPNLYSAVEIAWWSLKMRWWTWRKERADGLVGPDIQMFMVYRGSNSQSEVEISVGMRKGRYGIVKAQASTAHNARNMVVFAHELLHVLGATDKYVLSTGEPVFPHGYAQPEQRPLFPQSHAEIMGGRIPLTAYSSARPQSLAKCRIGRATAEEIGFFNKL